MTIDKKNLMLAVRNHVFKSIDFDKPFHGIIDKSNNQLLLLSNFKDTIKILLKESNRVIIWHMNESIGHENLMEFKEILDKHVYYNIQIESRFNRMDFVTEPRYSVFNFKKLSDNETYSDKISKQDAVFFKLKGMAFDAVYRHLNFVRSLRSNDILLDDTIKYYRYLQARNYINGIDDSTILLDSYADEIKQTLIETARYIVFQLEEDMHVLKMSEIERLQVEKLILTASSYDEIAKIIMDFIANNRYIL